MINFTQQFNCTLHTMLVFKLQTMSYTGISNLLLLMMLLCSMPAMSQERHVKDLEQNIYHLNNEFKYDQSFTAIHNFISSAKNNDERYYGFLFLS